jgi:SAM-dependent methyltransferase
VNETKFDGMGHSYAQYRPSYPKEFIDFLYSEVGVNAESIIADIGSGTGILTRQLLDRRSKVFAVEPNNDMRAIAEAELTDYKGYVSINGTAEETTLGDHYVDYITVAQAFHWFDRLRFKTECRRVLKPAGRAILVWNSRDEASALIRENEKIIKEYCPDYSGFSGGMSFDEDNNDFNAFFDGKYDVRIFQNDLSFDKQGFIGRNLSGSYAPKENENGYAAYIAALGELFDKYNNNGNLIMPNLTRSYVGKV